MLFTAYYYELLAIYLQYTATSGTDYKGITVSLQAGKKHTIESSETGVNIAFQARGSIRIPPSPRKASTAPVALIETRQV